MREQNLLQRNIFPPPSKKHGVTFHFEHPHKGQHVSCIHFYRVLESLAKLFYVKKVRFKNYFIFVFKGGGQSYHAIDGGCLIFTSVILFTRFFLNSGII